MKCCLLMTGNELMTGVTTDTNSAFIAQHLLTFGIAIHKKVTVGDDPQLLIQEINSLCNEGDILIINGGLGPTQDDLTAEVLATISNSPLSVNPAAKEHVEQWCQKRGLSVNDANLKQALLPEVSELIPNPLGSAVGIRLEHKDCLILATPGVPSEMRSMLKEHITPLLKQRFPNHPQYLVRRLQVFGIGESTIQQIVATQCPEWPEEVELGFRAGAPSLELKLTIESEQWLDKQKECEEKLREVLGAHIFGSENDTLPSVVIDILRERQQTIAFAESCTGGLMASMLTGCAGASQVFEFGAVTYSNRIKEQALHVSDDTLKQFGAVSDATVKEMLQGVLKESGADFGVAVSGIAGPDGGSEEKPVGTVHFAWGNAEQIKCHKVIYPAKRAHFQTMVAAYGLDLIRRFILDLESHPHFFRARNKG